MSIFDEAKIDCHNHVFDPARFPYAENSFYRPAGQELGTPAQFLQVLDAYGVRHALTVGPNSGYSTDNRCLLAAIARSGGRLKGVAVVPAEISTAGLEQLKAGGIVGIALNAALNGTAEYAGHGQLLERVAALGLFAQVQVRDDQLVELMRMLDASSARILIDHCGRPEVAAGLAQPGFRALLALGRSGRAVVKLSGPAKFSREAFPYADALPFEHALLEAFGPDACVWGSDWPFLRASERIDYGPLLKRIERLLPDADTRRKVLWETPRRLFGF